MTWSLENCELVGLIYDRHLAVSFSEYETLDALAKEWPDGFYVWCTHERIEPLVNAFSRLDLISRMLRIESFPLHGPNGAFVSSAEWLRVTNELILVRLSSIRDLVVLLVAAVHEIEVPEHGLTLGRLLKNPTVAGNAELAADLTRLARAGSNLRDERNRFVHEGLRRAFGDYQLFDTLAYMEASGIKTEVRPLVREDGSELSFELLAEHRTIARTLDEEFHSNAQTLHRLVVDIAAKLVPEWLARFEAKVMQRPGAS